MDTPTLQRRLRGVFDARVFNHGDYNVVYGQPSGSSSPLVIGYRHQPLEMLLCPFDPAAADDHRSSGADGDAVHEEDPHGPVDEAPAHGGDVIGVGLGNVATVADTGSGYQVETVTGFRASFEVEDTLRTVVASPTGHADATVGVQQAAAAESFHEFMDHFMDVLDGFYRVPDDTEGLQDTYNPPVAA